VIVTAAEAITGKALLERGLIVSY